MAGWAAAIAEGAKMAAQIGFQADEANKNRRFQQYSAKHQYQWAVEDLKAAGLNPMLAAMNGGPGNLRGVMPSSGDANFSGAFESANSARRIDEVDKENLKIQRDLADKNKEKSDSEIQVNKDLSNVYSAQEQKTLQDKTESEARVKAIVVQMLKDRSEIQANAARELRDLHDARYGNPLKVLGSVGEEVGKLGGKIINSLFSKTGKDSKKDSIGDKDKGKKPYQSPGSSAKSISTYVKDYSDY